MRYGPSSHKDALKPDSAESRISLMHNGHPFIDNNPDAYDVRFAMPGP